MTLEIPYPRACQRSGCRLTAVSGILDDIEDETSITEETFHLYHERDGKIDTLHTSIPWVYSFSGPKWRGGIQDWMAGLHEQGEAPTSDRSRGL